MPLDDIAQWQAHMWVDYRNELLAVGFTSESADANIERHQKALFSDGVPNADQHVLEVWCDEDRVGFLWLAKGYSLGDPDHWYVYDIVIFPEFRGRGWGRDAMLAGEEYAASRGGTQLSLNVWGHNTVARSLYESLEFVPVAIEMRKTIGPQLGDRS